MHKENAALWKVKPLLTKLVGDNTWAPCGMMIEENDQDLFTETARFLTRPTDPSPTVPLSNGRLLGESSLRETATMNETENSQHLSREQAKGKSKDTSDGEMMVEGEERTDEGHEANSSAVPDKEIQTRRQNGDTAPVDDKMEEDPCITDEVNENPHGDWEMVEAPPDDGAGAGREQETSPADNNDAADTPRNFNGGIPANLELLEELFIHPLFLAPRAAHPDRDIGLPEQEADDVRRILQLYVQKQEEVCRGTKKLYEGLLKADRLRKTVLQWSKAEAHCGPNRDLSDGEDWYDKEEWGITEDLKKGEDEVEEDTTQTQKKTRNRK